MQVKFEKLWTLLEGTSSSYKDEFYDKIGEHVTWGDASHTLVTARFIFDFVDTTTTDGAIVFSRLKFLIADGTFVDLES